MGKRFGGVGAAKMNRRGVFFDPGEYEIDVKRCEYMTARDKEEFFIVETIIVETNNPAHPVGAERNWMPKMNQDMSEVNLKGFCVACLGLEDADADGIAKVSDEDFQIMLEAALDGPDKENTNALAGTALHVSVVETTLKNGAKFNVCKFSPSKRQKKAA